MSALPRYRCLILRRCGPRRTAGDRGEGRALGRSGIVWALRGLVVLGGWAVAGVTFWDPRWGAAAAATAAVFITGSALWLAMTAGPLHQCPGRHRESLLRAAVDDNTRRIDQAEKFFGALGLSSRRAQGGLHLIQGVQEDERPEDGRSQRAGLLAG